MFYLRNKITGEICEFGAIQGDDWEELTSEELNSYLVEKTKKEKITELNQKASTKIYSRYSQQRQTNLINQAVAKSLENDPNIDSEYKAMNEFIAPIRSQRAEIEERINEAASVEELEVIEIDLEAEE